MVSHQKNIRHVILYRRSRDSLNTRQDDPYHVAGSTDPMSWYHLRMAEFDDTSSPIGDITLQVPGRPDMVDWFTVLDTRSYCEGCEVSEADLNGIYDEMVAALP